MRASASSPSGRSWRCPRRGSGSLPMSAERGCSRTHRDGSASISRSPARRWMLRTRSTSGWPTTSSRPRTSTACATRSRPGPTRPARPSSSSSSTRRPSRPRSPRSGNGSTRPSPPTPSPRSSTGCARGPKPRRPPPPTCSASSRRPALAVTLGAVRRARELPDLRAALAQEYGLVMWFATTQPDLVEGIRAQLVDKDRMPALAAGDARRAGTGCRGIRSGLSAEHAALGLRTDHHDGPEAPILDRDRGRLVLLRLRRAGGGVAGVSEPDRHVPGRLVGIPFRASRSGCCWRTSCCHVCIASSPRSTCPTTSSAARARVTVCSAIRSTSHCLARPIRSTRRWPRPGGRRPTTSPWSRRGGSSASTLTRRSYGEAPVSPLFLFSRQQDFAYQQEVDGNPAQRHHVRFWQCPDAWLLPGGTSRRLARGGHVRHGRRAVAVHAAGHPPDRRGHRHRARSHRADRHRRRPACAGGDPRGLLDRLSRTQRRRRHASAPTGTCRSSTSDQ